jgi:hypothetical protein
MAFGLYLRQKLPQSIPRNCHLMFAARKIGNLQEAFALLNCRRVPGRLNTTEVAVLLGFQEHDIPVLIAGKLLIPLGKPAQNAPKYFAAIDVIRAAEDRDWLSQATRLLSRHWSEKNGRKATSRHDC